MIVITETEKQLFGLIDSYFQPPYIEFDDKNKTIQFPIQLPGDDNTAYIKLRFYSISTGLAEVSITIKYEKLERISDILISLTNKRIDLFIADVQHIVRRRENE